MGHERTEAPSEEDGKKERERERGIESVLLFAEAVRLDQGLAVSLA
jgi:hypothetical protein